MNRGDSPQNLKKRKDLTQLDEQPPQKKKKQGRRKIKIEFIEDKSRRQITFSKRKAGIMKKAYELTTLTGTQALLLIASETGHVYTFATPKLQPFVTRQDGKALIQRCLNSPDPAVPMAEEAPPFAPPTPAPPTQVQNAPVEDQGVPPMPPFVESSLVLMVGKLIPVVPGFTASHFKDLSAVSARWSQQFQQPVVCLAGGYPSTSHDMFRSPNDRIMSEVVVGIKVAEVDYTSPHQPSFSIEKLRTFLDNSTKSLVDEIWREIATKPYVLDSASSEKHPWKPMPAMADYYKPPDLLQIPEALYVVSTYPNAFVNVVFGVRKQGSNGKGSQVVGISCHTPESHVCKLDIDDRNHQQRLQMMGGVEGIPYYHLLPELFK